MKFSRAVIIAVLLGFVARSIAVAKDIDPYTGTPLIRNVEPASGKPDSVHTAVGEYLGRSYVKELYLTNGKEDITVKIIRQSDVMIEFRVPADVKLGRYRLLILTGSTIPMLLEQPVHLDVLAQQ
jgi:hypothetical protein